MTVKHHLSDDLILAYATGELPEALSLVVASHMALCPQCRRALDAAEAIGGNLIETEEEVPVADDALAALFARIDALPAPAPAPKPEPVPAHRRKDWILPQPLRDYAGGDVGALRWRKLGGGAEHLPIETGDRGLKARLLKIPAGCELPEHGHRGTELTLVLAGSYYDDGAWFRRGDVEEADATVEHKPVAGPEETCICLVVNAGRLRFRGLLPRLAQPFLGI